MHKSIYHQEIPQSSAVTVGFLVLNDRIDGTDEDCCTDDEKKALSIVCYPHYMSANVS